MTPEALHGIFATTASLYVAATFGFFLLLGTGSVPARTWATRCLIAAGALHLGLIVGDWTHHSEFGSVRQMLTTSSLAIVVVYLLSVRNERLAVLGAFVTPVALLIFLLGGLGHNVPAVSESVRSALLPAHVAVNVLGMSAFTLAFAVASAYLVQERLLRRRKLTGLFQRLPPLDVLDSLGLKLLLIGFPLFTMGSVSGALWARQLATGLSSTQFLGLTSWAVFAIVLLLRVAAGWQGRRAAIGTLVGYLCALTVVASYALRGSAPGVL